MKPEFPPWFDLDAEYAQLEGAGGKFDTMACGMLRLGQPCGDTAVRVFTYEGPRGTQVFLGLCDYCSEWWAYEDERITAYWRKKQREWGVR